MRECSAQVEELNYRTKKGASSIKQATTIYATSNESSTLKKQRDNAREKVSRFKEIQALSEEDIAELQEENSDLSKALVAVESELSYISKKEPQHNLTDDFTIQTKKGKLPSKSCASYMHKVSCQPLVLLIKPRFFVSIQPKIRVLN